jgi:predicted transcriptional regulator
MWRSWGRESWPGSNLTPDRSISHHPQAYAARQPSPDMDPDAVGEGRGGELLSTEDPTFGHIMSCVFGLQDHESRTYLALLDFPGTTADELADRLDRDRSNVNRSLTALLDRDLVERNRRLLDGGGYVYQYRPKQLAETKERLHESIDEWVAAVHDEIDEFGPDEA